MSLYVGTSGWAFKEWKPDFYPAKLPQTKFLEHYAQRLSACEINNTFYRVPAPTTFAKWAAAAPESFRYAIKAQRMMTHRREMAPDARVREFISDFVKLCSTLGPRMGVILFQFPLFAGRNDAALDQFLAALPAGAAYAIEFRNEEWDSSDVTEKIASAGATVCVSDRTGEVPDSLPPGPVAYVRLRKEQYTDAERAGWLDLFKRESQARHVFAFVKHEEGPADDPYRGVALARWMVEHG